MSTQVAISRPVHRYKLALRDRQAGRGREEQAGGLRTTTWGWNPDENTVDFCCIPVAKMKILWGREIGKLLVEDHRRDTPASRKVFRFIGTASFRFRLFLGYDILTVGKNNNTHNNITPGKSADARGEIETTHCFLRVILRSVR